jgi:prepilin-type processing-associated H-X9-DG protein
MMQPYIATDPNQSPMKGLAPFGYKDHASFNLPRTSNFKHFTDGTSHTMLLSEVVQTAQDDIWDVRGDMLNDGEGCTTYMTINTPNTGTDVTPYFIPNPALPENPPGMLGGNAYKSARSRHPGGVNVVMADASLRFVTNEIAAATWRAMGTMNGGEAERDL